MSLPLTPARFAVTAAAAAALLVLPSPAAAHHPPRAGNTVGSWAAAPSGVDTAQSCADCTVRNVVHSTVGGSSPRIRLSNVFGTAALTVAHATVALPATAGGADVAAGTLRQVTFGGKAAATIPAGRDVLSDPVSLTVPAGHDVLVSTFTPGRPTPFTFHPSAQQVSYLATGADQAGATAARAFTGTTRSWYLATGLQLTAPAPGDVVAFGDSITDGYASSDNADHRWPDTLARRLLTLPPAKQLGVLNAGIGGNRILLDGGNGFGPSALSRFDRDALNQPGVRSIIILEGINDIQQTPHQLDPNKIIAGLQQLINRAHARHLRVLGGTLTPFKGWTTYDAQEEAARQAVNNWIRTPGHYDAFVDFDAAVRDPADPHRMLPADDSGDHLHPNDAGYAAMGNAVDLSKL